MGEGGFEFGGLGEVDVRGGDEVGVGVTRDQRSVAEGFPVGADGHVVDHAVGGDAFGGGERVAGSEDEGAGGGGDGGGGGRFEEATAFHGMDGCRFGWVWEDMSI